MGPLSGAFNFCQMNDSPKRAMVVCGIEFSTQTEPKSRSFLVPHFAATKANSPRGKFTIDSSQGSLFLAIFLRTHQTASNVCVS